MGGKYEATKIYPIFNLFPVGSNQYRLSGLCCYVARGIKKRMVGVRIKEGKWYEPNGYVFDRVNFKGEVVFRRNTKETLHEVENYLELKGIEYEVRSGAKILWIRTNRGLYSYYYTTGRWSPYVKGGYPKKHYKSNGIVDFITRFATGSLKQMYKKKEK